ncbi:MAG: hypothetical protein WKF77_08665 [Planctomycetaceae bacterium]
MKSPSCRIWQSGDSEYLINRQTARLKDVRELFVGTGAGAATYCIIEQGRVDQILQSNAANRRLIFEEAAGISRFKQKRTEALKRLERVEQNLVRLADLVDEVETQVSTVRTQAQRASRYRSVSTELEQLWVGLAADDFRRESTQRVYCRPRCRNPRQRCWTCEKSRQKQNLRSPQPMPHWQKSMISCAKSNGGAVIFAVGLPVWNQRFAIRPRERKN